MESDEEDGEEEKENKEAGHTHYWAHPTLLQLSGHLCPRHAHANVPKVHRVQQEDGRVRVGVLDVEGQGAAAHHGHQHPHRRGQPEGQALTTPQLGAPTAVYVLVAGPGHKDQGADGHDQAHPIHNLVQVDQVPREERQQSSTRWFSPSHTTSFFFVIGSPRFSGSTASAASRGFTTSRSSCSFSFWGFFPIGPAVWQAVT
mmetsp:Transcript_5039/g.7660  ORF Transcript_5039/g.7660 Transcript_5039/m.7660 type:complete len:201 (-) Transcript_5039:139-741(-)